MTAPASLVAANFGLRPLTPEELAHFWPMSPGSFLDDPVAPSLGQLVLRVPQATALMEYRVEGSLQSRHLHEEAARGMLRLVAALQLMGFDPRGDGRGWTFVEPYWTSRAIGSLGISLKSPSIFASATTLTIDTWTEVASLAESFVGSRFEASESREQLAVTRFRMGASRDDSAQAIVDFVVCLETLLLPGNNRDELRNRFALNGAVLLAEDRAARRALYGRLRKLYDFRSSLVHARSGRPTRSDVADFESDARELTAQVIRQALKHGWPTDSEILDRLLS